jgi:hypothetical protein
MPGPSGMLEETQHVGTRFVKVIEDKDDQEILIPDFERLLHAS